MNSRSRARLFFLLVIVVLVLTAGSVAASKDALARRDAIRIAGEAGAIPPPFAVVDGTPRPHMLAPAIAPTFSSRDRDDPATNPPRERALASLGTVIGDQGMAAQLGGDDVAIVTAADAGPPYLCIASDGTLLMAVSKFNWVRIYRSTDGGDTWTLWSEFMEPGGPSLFMGDFEIAEGAADRVFIAYGVNVGTFQIHVARATLGAGAPTWTIVTAFSMPGVTFPTGLSRVDIDTDQEVYDAYYVYTVTTGGDADGIDVWFNVSTNQGTSFGTPYRIVNNTAGSSVVHDTPMVRFGSGDWVHVTYEKYSSPPPLETGLYYLRAPDWASGGAGSWEGPQTLNPIGPSDPAENMGLEASLMDATVISIDGTRVRYSLNSGATWPPANNRSLPVAGNNDGSVPIAIAPSGEVTVFTSQIGGCPSGLCIDEVYLFRSTTADLQTWTQGYESALSIHNAAPINVHHRPGLASDPTHGGRYAAVWWIDDFDDDSNDMVRFDAEWRRDPGYANTEAGFPMSIPGLGETPPAVAEIDGDLRKEIVFGTRSGNVQVVNHDGSVVTGWPVDIGVIPFDAPVAIGDLVGNGDVAIVAGNSTGQVYAFDKNGALWPGWPVDLGTATNVYVSIGALGPPNLHYVVAVSGTKVAILNYLGVNVAPAWSNIPFGTYTRPAAIGDIDNDEVGDIVSLAGPNIYFHHKNLVAFEGYHFAGETFSDAPTLADVDLDGDLEIAAPTTNGRMYLLHHTFADVTGWPIDFTPGVALTSAAIAQILGTSAPEIVFAERNGNVHIRYATGVEQSGFPKDVTATILYMPPMVAPVSVSSSNVSIGNLQGVGHSYRNISGIVTPGWPRNLPGVVEETFASGDIDNDGRNEIVVLGQDFLTVLDVGVAPSSDPRGHWPMYGYDAQRTGCLACEETAAAIGDTPGANGRLALEVSPNPFNPTTLIEFEIANDGPVSLDVYDVAGRHVTSLLHEEHRSAGRHSLRYEPGTASGVYFLKLTSRGESTVRKMVLLK